VLFGDAAGGGRFFVVVFDNAASAIHRFVERSKYVQAFADWQMAGEPGVLYENRPA
jgi:hypothetical protein